MVNLTEMALRERQRTSPLSELRGASRLTSHWYKDDGGALVIRWVLDAEPDKHRLPDALAA
jgi:hypothetical protein